MEWGKWSVPEVSVIEWQNQSLSLQVIPESRAADDYKYIDKLSEWSFSYYSWLFKNILLILYKPVIKFIFLYYFLKVFHFFKAPLAFWRACG